MHTALVIVDMLNDFVDGVLANPSAKEVVVPIASLAERARASDDWVVVYANDAHHLTDVELRVFPPHAMAGTAGAAVVSELQPGPEDTVVTKRFYSAFTDTNLETALRVHDVGRVVLVGQHTDCCIRHTSYDAFVREYELVVCPDATTVFEPGADEPVSSRQHRALEYLHTYYGANFESASTVG
jgi:nicotinamidase-related amidase